MYWNSLWGDIDYLSFRTSEKWWRYLKISIPQDSECPLKLTLKIPRNFLEKSWNLISPEKWKHVRTAGKSVVAQHMMFVSGCWCVVNFVSTYGMMLLFCCHKDNTLPKTEVIKCHEHLVHLHFKEPRPFSNPKLHTSEEKLQK